MSTLTKILIVLLTVASILLCGILVTYVGFADDYKSKNETLKKQLNASEKTEAQAKKEKEEFRAASQRLEDQLRGDISSLKNQIGELQGKLTSAEREKNTLLQKVTGFASEVEAFTKTNEQQGKLLQSKLDELKKVGEEKIKFKKDLDETSHSLLEKLAIIEDLEIKIKRLLEDKTDLEEQLVKYLHPKGIEAASRAVTVTQGPAQEAAVTRAIGLKGAIAAVDLKNSMASISLGKADGVKKTMKFFVTRGGDFICEIVIIDVEAEESVGILKLVQEPPKIGDKVDTNL